MIALLLFVFAAHAQPKNCQNAKTHASIEFQGTYSAWLDTGELIYDVSIGGVVQHDVLLCKSSRGLFKVVEAQADKKAAVEIYTCPGRPGAPAVFDQTLECE